jgi:hypothetical protein
MGLDNRHLFSIEHDLFGMRSALVQIALRFLSQAIRSPAMSNIATAEGSRVDRNTKILGRPLRQAPQIAPLLPPVGN